MPKYHGLCLACALLATTYTAAAAAETASSQRATQDTTARRFDLPAQPLADVLTAFAKEAGVTIRLDASIQPGVQAPALSGVFTLPDAVSTLLGTSGLQARFLANRTVVIARSPADGSPVYNLRPVEVLGVRNQGYSTVRTSSATKTETPLRDTPQSISVVTRDVIADQSMQSMGDVVRYIPGVSMGLGEGHRDAPTIRGNSSTADFFVDGVRDDAQYYRDLYNTERVEALKGSNAMIFGRGGLGGVINRVTKEPEWAPLRTFTVEGGSFDHRRTTADLSQPLSGSLAARFNGLFENSHSYRANGEVQRYAVNPTALWALGQRTSLHASYEFFRDDRTVDRGIPSFGSGPAQTDRSTFFGYADSSYAHARVHTAGVLLEHKTNGGITIRNRARFTDYDKFYQNVYAGSAVNTAGTDLTLSAYNNGTLRQNLINQTDVTATTRTGFLQHTVLVGAEVSRQRTNNYRETGYFNNSATSFGVALSDPTVEVPVTFRQSATDADNRSVVTVSAVYAQDQLQITEWLQALAGLRYERFNIDFHNNRNSEDLARVDELLSPRAGLVLKPLANASVYGSYSVTHLPSSGDQFSSLTATTQTLEPEQFTNYEIGAKWDVRPNFAITVAAYQLDRTNTSAPDPLDSKKTVQTGSQRTRGVEAGVSWKQAFQETSRVTGT
jgi:catecholate siderophore receptor